MGLADIGKLLELWEGAERSKRRKSDNSEVREPALLEHDILDGIINAAVGGNVDAANWLEDRGFISLPQPQKKRKRRLVPTRGGEVFEHNE